MCNKQSKTYFRLPSCKVEPNLLVDSELEETEGTFYWMLETTKLKFLNVIYVKLVERMWNLWIICGTCGTYVELVYAELKCCNLYGFCNEQGKRNLWPPSCKVEPVLLVDSELEGVWKDFFSSLSMSEYARDFLAEIFKWNACGCYLDLVKFN